MNYEEIDAETLKRAASRAASGVQGIALLALCDDGAPSYDHGNAAALAGFGSLWRSRLKG